MSSAVAIIVAVVLMIAMPRLYPSESEREVQATRRDVKRPSAGA